MPVASPHIDILRVCQVVAVHTFCFAMKHSIVFTGPSDSQMIWVHTELGVTFVVELLPGF